MVNACENRWPQRKRLPHDIPSWVPDGARYFVTINCAQRGADSLCRSGVAEALIEGIRVYQQQGRWYVWLLVVMPDHVHLIVSANRERGLRRTVSAWKGYFARTVGIRWQAGFFEHRLRSDSEFDEKAAYVRASPVRKGLVTHDPDWPYVWDASSQDSVDESR